MRHLTLSVCLFTLISAGVQASDDPYGLLFTTPDERLRLDNRFSDHGGSNGSQAGAAHTEPQSTRPLKVNGTLVSSVGKKEVWINGKSQFAPGDDSGGHVRLLNAGRVRLKPSSSGKAHDMKPGQILDPNTGAVSEAYQQLRVPAANTDTVSNADQQALAP